MKILITGGAGYIGTELVKKLVDHPEVEEIIIYDNLTRGSYSFFLTHGIGGDHIRFVQADLLNTRKIKKIVQEVDVVYHLAARIQTPFAETDPHLFEQVNHWGTAELSYALEEATNIKAFIHISSISVYGASTKGKFLNDQSKVNPRTNYGISKMRGEGFVERLMKLNKFPVYLLRVGNVYGHSNSMRFDAVINKFAFEANFLNRINIHGDGQQTRAFIHVNQLSSNLAQIPFKNIPSGTYNMIDNNHSIMDIAMLLKDLIPDLEMLFINQHLKLKDMLVDENCEIYKYLEKEPSSLKLDMIEMINQFAFHPNF
ncbi:MAG TPA: NAD-dependent epimerase/dehydratase [Chitinophagales bacterium]|nr:NAD-dependent epimerase/dehydratase [Chitinophagales bacterium]